MKNLWNKGMEIYKKYKTQILYLIFGGLTTLVNWIVYFSLTRGFGLEEMLTNVIAWAAAVLFAFLTNRTLVFNASVAGVKAFIFQMIMFFAGRLVTLGLEEAIMWLLYVKLGINDIIVKVIAAIVVVVTNYFISKLVVFRKKEKTK
ncbi:MAG: GtrA family protein [Lachnospiraceae bacterium]|nr:GtrA family protein [Lachnospiraceae bacterium]